MSTLPPDAPVPDPACDVQENRSKNTPSLCRHKKTNQGYVIIDGRWFYLGDYDQPRTKQRYHQLIAEWLACGRMLPQDKNTLTIIELADLFWQYAKTYYVSPTGKPTTELAHFKQLLKMIKKLYGFSKAADFGPLALKALRQEMIDKGWCRINVNHHVGRIKRIFRWATENELVPGNSYHSLQAVVGLKRGHCQVREGRTVRPVPMHMVEAIRPFVSQQVWAIIQLQLFTAARSGEIVIMRPCDIDRSGKIWVYKPTDHKTAYRGHERNIYMGPNAQKIVTKYLLRPGEAYCFSPIEAEAARREKMHEDRDTPLSCGNKPGSNRKDKPSRLRHDHYDPQSYGNAIAQACERAFPLPENLGRKKGESRDAFFKRLKKDPDLREQVKQWRREHRWHPHQLRHNAATELRKEFGLESARIILGHRSSAVTTIYAEEDNRRALEVMAKFG
ncbi:MAG: tyrosine-type recombinase/integrase [Planctomycetaceae bacterium]|nr:tyrosine-type recombinase/integrase [Planctomycetaceae bacterium]